MIDKSEQISKEVNPQDTFAALQRILRAVEKDERQHWMEITCAIVLSLATTASAWCAYEATRWSGVQTFQLSASNAASRAGAAAQLSAIQIRTFDASMLISYLNALSRKDKEEADFLIKRFRSDLKVVIEAWLAMDPFNNPDAPLTPFKMEQYKQPEIEDANRNNQLADQLHAKARHASETSDRYVLLTVMFASVMFFGGIGGTFESRRLRNVSLAMSVLLCTFTLIILITMPICPGST